MSRSRVPSVPEVSLLWRQAASISHQFLVFLALEELENRLQDGIISYNKYRTRCSLHTPYGTELSVAMMKGYCSENCPMQAVKGSGQTEWLESRTIQKGNHCKCYGLGLYPWLWPDEIPSHASQPDIPLISATFVQPSSRPLCQHAWFRWMWHPVKHADLITKYN